MNVNRRRGEVTARLDDRDYRLCLTLGALAELETAFAAGDLRGLVERFSSGALSASDMIAVIGAGLRGGGNVLDDSEVAGMRCDDGVAGFARIVSDLLQATFGSNAPPNP